MFVEIWGNLIIGTRRNWYFHLAILLHWRTGKCQICQSTADSIGFFINAKFLRRWEMETRARSSIFWATITTPLITEKSPVRLLEFFLHFKLTYRTKTAVFVLIYDYNLNNRKWMYWLGNGTEYNMSTAIIALIF